MFLHRLEFGATRRMLAREMVLFVPVEPVQHGKSSSSGKKFDKRGRNFRLSPLRMGS
jgi:hypothetical protein